MEDTVELLRRQARSLEAMSEDSDRLKGKYAQTIREKSEGTSQQLKDVALRYENVLGHLTSWAESMEEAQEKASTALDMAQCAEGDMKRCESLLDDLDDEDEDSDTERALERAQSDYGDAETLLNTAEEDYREAGDACASAIRDDVDDNIKDSLWDRFSGWIDEAGWLDDLMTALTWAGTIAGLAAIFIPGLGQLALILTIAVGVHNVAKFVTGNGSLVDVLVSVGCLRFIGKGLKATKKLADVHKKAKKQSTRASRNNAKKADLRDSHKQRKQNNSKKKNKPFHDRAREAGNKAAREERGQQDPATTMREKIRACGDRDAASQNKDLNRMADKHPDNKDIQHAANAGDYHFSDHQISWAQATGLDVTDKGVGVADSMTDPNWFNDLKDNTTIGAG